MENKKSKGKKLYKITYIHGFYKEPKNKESWVEMEQIDYVWANDKDNAEYKFIMSERAWGWVSIKSIRQSKGQD